MRYRRGPILVPLILITLGIIFLYDNLTGGAFDVGAFIARWWPVLLILVGIEVIFSATWGRGRWPSRDLALELGGVDSAQVRIQFGAGVLDVGRAQPGRIVDGHFEGPLRAETTPGRVSLGPDPGAGGWGWWGRGFDWRVGLTGEVPLGLLVETGASRNRLDLSELRLSDLDFRTGASDTRIVLPRAAGQTSVRLEAGAASVEVEVPQGVAARVRSAMALGTSDIDQRRFPMGTDGVYASPDYAAAPNRVEIDIRGGVGHVSVR
jgi:hypothetical protein